MLGTFATPLSCPAATPTFLTASPSPSGSSDPELDKNTLNGLVFLPVLLIIVGSWSELKRSSGCPVVIARLQSWVQMYTVDSWLLTSRDSGDSEWDMAGMMLKMMNPLGSGPSMPSMGEGKEDSLSREERLEQERANKEEMIRAEKERKQRYLKGREVSEWELFSVTNRTSFKKSTSFVPSISMLH